MEYKRRKLINAGVKPVVVDLLIEVGDVNTSELRLTTKANELNYKYLLSVTRKVVGSQRVDARESINTYCKLVNATVDQLSTIDYLVIKIMERLVASGNITEAEFISGYTEAMTLDREMPEIDYIVEAIRKAHNGK